MHESRSFAAVLRGASLLSRRRRSAGLHEQRSVGKDCRPTWPWGTGFMEEGSLSQKVAVSTRAKSHCPSSRRQFAYHYAAQPKLA